MGDRIAINAVSTALQQNKFRFAVAEERFCTRPQLHKEVVIGATCTLNSNGKAMTATTDGFGDFWFEGLEDGIYNLKIEAKGFAAKTFDKLNAEKDINLGDIPLSK